MVMYKRRFWWLPLLLIVTLMMVGFAILFARLDNENERLAAEARDRCLVITAIIDFAAPSKPVTLPVPADATPALRQVIELSNGRAVANNHRLRRIADRYLPRPC